MATPKFRMVSTQASGIGGWLLFFVFSQAVAIGVLAWSIPGTIAELRGPDAVIVGIVLFLQIARVVAYIIGLGLLFRRDPRTPKFHRLVFAGVGLITLLETIGSPSVANARAIVACVIWYFYWRNSERVRLTFAPKTP
jgi:hypothetical protein